MFSIWCSLVYSYSYSIYYSNHHNHKTNPFSSIAIMNTLRYREHISLPDLYTLILSSPQFKEHLQTTNRLTNSPTPTGGMTMNGLSFKNGNSFMNQNLELLRSVLMEGSSKYIIQEDRKAWKEGFL